MHLTRFEFRQRFTVAERTAIELASADVPSAPQEQRIIAASLRAYLADLEAAEFVDIERQDVADGVNALATFGLIAPTRPAEILALPAQEFPPVGGLSVGQLVRVKPPLFAAFPGEYPIVGFGPNCVELAMGQFDVSLVEAV
jgi:hypothetical protein